MKNGLLLLSGLLCASVVFTQPANSVTDVGVVEHLGDTLPLDLRFINEQDDTVTLRELIHKPAVLSFVYFDCPGLCSPLLSGVSDVIAKSDLVLGKDYDAITISFNYRDNPEKARKKKINFLQQHSKENAQHWMYLTSDSASIYAIINAVGYKIKAMGLDYAHPSAIVIVSPEGKITRYLYGLSYLPFDFKMAITEASQGLARPTVQRVMQYCFSYDVRGQKYVMDITKVSATITILIALIVLLVLIFKPKRKGINKEN